MKEFCAKCGKELDEGANCHGITAGRISEEVEGFFMDDSTPWDILCDDCHSAVMKFIYG